MPTGTVASLDTSRLVDPILFIAAAETEDELGCVLRFHLATENLLEFFVTGRLTPELATYIKIPKEHGAKLAFAVALGLPLPIAAVAKQINNIRNGLAHGKVATLDKGNIQQLGRLVDKLKELDEQHAPLSKRYIELPVRHPGRRITYGSDCLRLDFVLAAFSFLVTAQKWVVLDASLRKLAGS